MSTKIQRVSDQYVEKDVILSFDPTEESWLCLIVEIYHSTMPSATALNRAPVLGSMGSTCLQSGSFSREELM